MRIAVLVSLALAGCNAIVDNPEQAVERTRGASDYALCYNASDTRLFAGERQKAAQIEIQRRHLTCDWAVFARVHAQEQATAAANFNTGMSMMAAARPAPAPVYVAPRAVNCTAYGPQTNCTAY